MSIVTLLYANTISIFGYIFTADNVNVFDLMFIIAASATVTYMHLFLPLMTHLYRNELQSTIEYIENEFGFPQKLKQRTVAVTQERPKYNSVSLSAKWFLFLAIVYSLVAFPSIIYVVTFCDQRCLGDQQLYLFGIPFVSRIQSHKVYFLAYWFTLIFTIWTFLASSSIILLTVMFGCEFYNAYANLGAHFHNVMDNTIHQLKTGCNSKEKKIQSKFLPTFKKELEVIVKHHQFLTRYYVSMSFLNIITNPGNLHFSFSTCFPIRLVFSYHRMY